jgi:aspartate ammonia-lyase
MRKEKDFIGQLELPEDVLYGIHAQRSIQNFANDTRFHVEWYRAIGLVKLAAYRTIIAFHGAAVKQMPNTPLPAGLEDINLFAMLNEAAAEVSSGKHFEYFIVPAVQGGAGTSINMNINEIITNVALQKAGRRPGSYEYIDPLKHANLFQSTNDVVPTALKLASMQLLVKLEDAINALRASVEKIEGRHRNDLRIAYTQMQEALPSSWGMLFSAYSDALSRDWWRVSKCFERIKLVNLGGGATGSGLAIPRYYVMEAVAHLQKLTNMPLTRSENLNDATQNLDAFVEVHAILKAHAVNLEKMAADIRLLASDVTGPGAVSIPQQQVGSSIMPGKVNPVIPEYVISIAHKVYSNDMLITSLCGQACLDLNAYLPVIGHAMLESLKLLIAAGSSMKDHLLDGLIINASLSVEKLYMSPSITTALVPVIGYGLASEMARYMKEHHCDVFAANKFLDYLPAPQLGEMLKPERLLRLGYSIKE